MVIGLEVHCELRHRHEAVLRRAATSSAPSPTPTSARCASACPGRCRCSTSQAVELRHAHRRGARTARCRPSDLPPEELLLSGHAEGLPGHRSTTSRSTSTAGSSCPTARASASSGPTSRRTPASPPTSAAAGASTAPTTRLVDYNRAGVPLLEIVSEPDLRTAEDAKAYVERAAGHPRGHRRRPTGRWRRARCGSTPTCRCARGPTPRSAPAARSRTSTRSARSAGPSSTRSHARSTCSRPASAIVQETRHWDEDDGRTPLHALQGGGRTTTATSPSPTSCPSRPTTSGVPPSGRRCRPCRRRAPGRPGRGRRRRRPATWRCLVERDLDELVLDAIAAGADPRDRHQPGRQRGRRRDRAHRPADRADVRRARHHGVERQAHRHPGQAGAGRAAGR